MKKYTLSFIFNSTLDKVLLIHKLTPEWQVGKINGLGGKIEQGEDSLTCIMREIKEESNLDTEKEKWNYIGTMGSQSWTADVFCYVYLGNIADAKTMEAEKIEWFPLDSLPLNMIENLHWLIPLSLDKLKNNHIESFSVHYL